jgi:predicted nucleic acid-binding protein
MASTSRTPGGLFCDTNVLVRLLTDDPPDQAAAAESALDASGAGRFVVILTDVVVAELAYVLTEVYELRPVEASDRIAELLDLEGIEVADQNVLRTTLEIWSRGKLDFADAYLAALTQLTRDTGVLSFDKDFDRIDGVRRINPSRV